MSGFGWDDDDLVDDMMMLDFLEDEEADDAYYDNRPAGSCLMFVVSIGIAGLIPIVSLIKFLA